VPAYRLPVTKGEQYAVVVTTNGHCAGKTGEYRIVVDTSFDPTLTVDADDQPRSSVYAQATITGEVTLPMKP
jgi:hypothetical protein